MARNATRLVLIVASTLVAALVAIAIGAASADVPGLPSSMRSAMLQRTFGGDPAAQNLPYVLATFEAVSWYERAVIPGITGIIVGLLSTLIRSFTARDRLAVGLLGFIVLLLIYGVTDPAPWFGGVLFCTTLIGAGSFSSLRRPAVHLSSS